ncbi:hypothetical protein E2986_11106 [Frieseomelitta varia]|uniref:PUM-HD domain-containing protein n=1 Tax=Frieseomelitta varia TaxID=561572 RepID=A0A833W8R1_9HYME|nr:hypothetical protein E2986_11106 [Frieseomelitta varia]
MAGGDSMRIQPGQTHQIGVNRTQDDAMAPRAWALADDAIIDNNPEKWKYPITKLSVPQNQPQQLGLQTMNNVHLPYEIHPMQLKSGAPGAEHLVYLNNQMTAQQQVALFHHQQQQQQQQFRNGQIAPSAKKLWGVDEGGSKDEGGVKGGGILHLGDHQMWRDSTWSTSDHAVSQPISMGTGRRVGVGTGYHHQTSEVGTVLSPRSSETGGLGVKMVEYVLGSSPTTPKDLEPRMVSLRLNTDADKKEKEKGSASPFDSSKDDTGPQNNGLASQNGLDDDKGFNRTPGSRQPSPGEEEFQKNAATTLVSAGGGGVVLLKPGVDVVGSEEHFMAAFAPAPPHHLQHHQAPPTHHLQHPHSHAAQLFGAQAPPPPQGPPPSQQQQQQQGPPQPQDTTTHFDVQVQGQYQVIPAYYDQNGSIVMGGVRGLSSAATPMRLVSPAPVLVNRAPSQPPPGPPAPPPPSLYSQPTPTSHSNATPGECLGLGLGASSTARRDSFDRNTSAFSPSLEYSRAKWPQSYGALGTVTASPSPLGLSLTPPPTLGGSLGGLVGGPSRVSAAPGAEAKFRASAVPALTANGVFGSSSSLFPNLVGKPGRGGTTSIGDKNAGGRSRLLEDFRNNRYVLSDLITRGHSYRVASRRSLYYERILMCFRFPSLQLRDLANHIVEFSQDQHGSRFIQQKLERASASEKQLVFQEILTSAYSLMTDVFGNYVIQKFFEFGTPEQKSTLAQKVIITFGISCESVMDILNDDYLCVSTDSH